jgi:hypothetical protein
MNLFFLIGENEGPAGRLLDAVTSLVPKDKLEVFLGLASLSERLRRPRDGSCALLVLGPSHRELMKIIGLREFLKEAKILLVLADQDESTISLAHKVMPTYISDFDGDTTGVVSVLKQLVRDSAAREGRV